MWCILTTQSLLVVYCQQSDTEYCWRMMIHAVGNSRWSVKVFCVCLFLISYNKKWVSSPFACCVFHLQLLTCGLFGHIQELLTVICFVHIMEAYIFLEFTMPVFVAHACTCVQTHSDVYIAFCCQVFRLSYDYDQALAMVIWQRLYTAVRSTWVVCTTELNLRVTEPQYRQRVLSELQQLNPLQLWTELTSLMLALVKTRMHLWINVDADETRPVLMLISGLALVHADQLSTDCWRQKRRLSVF